MKKHAIFVILTILFSLLLNAYAFAYYDTFGTAPMDKNKWRWLEAERFVSNGKLHMDVKSCDNNGIWLSPSAEATSFMKAKVSVNSNSYIPASASGMIRLAGQFYNDSRGPGSGQEYNEFEGEVRCEIMIYLLEGGNLEARAQVWRFDEADPAGSHTSLFSQWFALTISFDTEYELSLEFTGSTVVFKCNDETLTYDIEGSVYTSFTNDRYLTSRVEINEYTGECGEFKAQVDNIFFDKTGISYDTFDGTEIDTDKWYSGDFLRRIEDGKLRLKVAQCDGRGNNTVSPTATNENGYIEAKVTVNEGSVSQGKTGYARLASYFYNEKRGPGSGLDYNRYQDNVWSTVRLLIDETGGLKAEAGVWRSDDPDELYGTSLQYEDFKLPIEFGQEYTLSMRFDGSKIIFKCNSETIQYNVQTPIYAPYDNHFYLQSRVFNDEGQCGFIDTTYDDLLLNPVYFVDFNTDNDVDGKDLSYFIQQITNETAQITIEEFAAKFGDIVTKLFFPTYGIITQHFPDGYDLGMGFGEEVSSVSVDGPNIDQIGQTDFGIYVGLTTRPDIGDEYIFHINFTDGTSHDQIYTVTNINDFFVPMISPGNGETITTTMPTFIWENVIGSECSEIIVSDDSGIIWWSPVFPTGSNTCEYNYNGTATTDLQDGQTYSIQINSYDAHGDSATTRSSFSIALSTPEPIAEADITIDGNTSDWAGILPVTTSAEGCNSGLCLTGADVKNLWLATKGNLLYFMFETYNGLDTTGEVGYRLWFDNNRNGQLDNDPEDRQVSISFADGTYSIRCQGMDGQTVYAYGVTASNGNYIEGYVDMNELGLSDSFRLEAGTHSESSIDNFDRFSAVANLMANDGIEPDSSLDVIVECYPASYYLALKWNGNITNAEFLPHPYIIGTFQGYVELSGKPVVGNSYVIRLHYNDGTTKDYTYTITNINDKYAQITNPLNNQIIDNSNFTLSWIQPSGIVMSYFLYVGEITPTGHNPVWSSDFDAGVNSCVYNFDGSAAISLKPGTQYMVVLHSVNENYNTATSVIEFTYQ